MEAVTKLAPLCENYRLDAVAKLTPQGDRSDENLLFQVMLDLGVPLSAKIEKKDILGADVYFVEYGDDYLTACFGKVTGDIITELAKGKPYFSVFRDGGFENDSAFVNAEQILIKIKCLPTGRQGVL